MELPSITTSSYASSAVDQRLFGGALLGGAVADRRMQQDPIAALLHVQGQQNQALNAALKPKEPLMSNARIVKVFIADSNENLPLEKRVLYRGEEKLTDLTDQELFFDVPMAELLAKHNALRATVVDKKQAEKFGRDIFLEPARIRDLKMVVVTVAQF